MRHGLQLHSNSVWPPAGAVLVFVLVYGALYLGIWFLQSMAPDSVGRISELEEVAAVQTGLLAFFAGWYALFRLWRFHPACNSQYAGWLKLSPWTAGKPLPLGPVHLVWQDLAVVGAIVTVAKWPAGVDPTTPAVVFGMVYLGGISLLLVITQRWTPFAILGFLWPLVFLPGIPGAAKAGAVLAIIGTAWYGHRESMRSFPWEPLIALNPSPAASGKTIALTNAVSRIGWPWAALAPRVERLKVSTLTSLIASALAGWWGYALLRIIDEEVEISGLLFLLSLVGAMVRLLNYCSGLAAPFNIRGRLASRRLVVPGFDKVFLTPLIAVLLGLFLDALLERTEAWHFEVAAGGAALILFVLLSGGPTLQAWLLTGQHRLRSAPNVSTTRLTPL